MIFEFKKVHVGYRVADGLLKGRLEARTTYIAMFQRRKAEEEWRKASGWRAC